MLRAAPLVNLPYCLRHTYDGEYDGQMWRWLVHVGMHTDLGQTNRAKQKAGAATHAMLSPSCHTTLATDLLETMTMRSPWSLLPNLSIATVAISQADVAHAAAAPLPERASAISGMIVLQGTTDAWMQVNAWLGDNYLRAPALMLVLAVLLALPPLAIAGYVLRRNRGSPDATVLISRPSRRTAETPSVTTRTELSAWPTEAWVEAEGHRYVVGRALLRIGREDDNDVCLPEKTVHRYHAVIRRTTDGDVVITDLSGSDGNGVVVNGKRIAESRLKPGDVIGIGEVMLNFDARPI